MSTLASRKQQILTAVDAIMADARRLYNVTFTPTVRFDLRGASAGQAGRNGGLYYLRFNAQLMMEDAGWEHILNDTVSHELGHLVCYERPELGNRHNAGWVRVARSLGSTGTRCHSLEVMKGTGDTIAYTTSTGHVILVGTAVHNKILRGATFSTRGNKGKLTKDCARVLVGRNGVRVAATPIANTPTAAPTKPASTASMAPAYNGTNGTKSSRVRGYIKNAKAYGENMDSVIEQAIALLGMKRGLARAYVQNNWNKV